MRDESLEAVARRAANTERKRNSRARAKEKQLSAAAQKASEITSFPEFWERNRATLTEDERRKFEQRESDVQDIQHYIRLYLDGRENVFGLPEDERILLPELIEIVKEDVERHGTCMEMVLVVEGLWTDNEANLRQRILAKGGATADLIRFGYIIAITQQLLHQFQLFSTKSQSNVTTTHVQMQCESCTGPFSIETIPESIAADYAKRNIKYLCGRCRALETKSRAIARGHSVEFKQPQSVIFDNCGRVKD